MTQTTIQINAELEKIKALQIYLSKKDDSVESELTEYIDALYKKYVPANVREFIDDTDALESESRKTAPRRTASRKPASGKSENGGADTDGTD